MLLSYYLNPLWVSQPESFMFLSPLWVKVFVSHSLLGEDIWMNEWMNAWMKPSTVCTQQKQNWPLSINQHTGEILSKEPLVTKRMKTKQREWTLQCHGCIMMSVTVAGCSEVFNGECKCILDILILIKGDKEEVDLLKQHHHGYIFWEVSILSDATALY